ncbi:hypothetical protein [Variovorax guangxiensis]|uniref:Uncharacterized protein n=1 Tax=Variovorax guangxiensis TaxID=1775474 RepID=A0A502DXM0_9BURK|nr:hypothetical protein [Variovorax guangxiensis]RZI63942.1 MAG: hypothetical protein EOP79_16600 [Variovorax sp.]TPG26368.1 hypothetical protein EAH83_00885 [Variovorax ginsengisoli]TPG30093.1 hypothetical protein EAH82_00885 [Variovorax guangxiensis]
MPTEAGAVELPDGPFDGRTAFQSHLHVTLAAAAQQGWREIVFADSDFADWPLGERASIAALQAWAASGRSLLLVAESFGVFDRSHARFVEWRRLWSHIVDARACSGSGAPSVPSAVWTPSWSLHRIDPAHSRGVSSGRPEHCRALRERIDECLRQSKPAFPASTLGL